MANSSPDKLFSQANSEASFNIYPEPMHNVFSLQSMIWVICRTDTTAPRIPPSFTKILEPQPIIVTGTSNS